MGLMDNDPKVSLLESTLATEKEPIECDDNGKFQFIFCTYTVIMM